MGNRAVIAFDKYEDDAIGIYLHWNGGRDSIEGFLKATKKIMDGRVDAVYARARLIEAIGIFIGGNLSFGMGHCKELDCDNYDNGVYVVDSETLEIIGRHHFHGEEQTEHDPDEIAEIIMRKIKSADIRDMGK